VFWNSVGTVRQCRADWQFVYVVSTAGMAVHLYESIEGGKSGRTNYHNGLDVMDSISVVDFLVRVITADKSASHAEPEELIVFSRVQKLTVRRMYCSILEIPHQAQQKQYPNAKKHTRAHRSRVAN